MKASYHIALGVLCGFFVLVFAISFFFHWDYPMYIVAGESSVGTWMSGTLLIMSATLSLIIGMRHGWIPWFLVTVFFMMLALDERFMFHEQIKERIIFSFHTEKVSCWLYELPVIVGACIGALMTFLLWNYMKGASRILLLCAMALGTASVVIDIFAAGVLWEEFFKLLAELSVTCALLKQID